MDTQDSLPVGSQYVPATQWTGTLSSRGYDDGFYVIYNTGQVYNQSNYASTLIIKSNCRAIYNSGRCRTGQANITAKYYTIYNDKTGTLDVDSYGQSDTYFTKITSDLSYAVYNNGGTFNWGVKAQLYGGVSPYYYGTVTPASGKTIKTDTTNKYSYLSDQIIESTDLIFIKS